MKCKIYTVEGVLNVRDLGGYMGLGNVPLAYGYFLRSASLSNLSKSGEVVLRDIGVDCIIDLRSTREVKHAPDTLCDVPGITYHHVPLLDGIQSNLAKGISLFPASMKQLYLDLLKSNQEDFRKIIQMCSKDYRTVLFHCTAGKDRTGLVAMLLLSIAGVSQEDIVEDYSYTQQLIEPMTRPNLPQYVFESRPETMEKTLNFLDREYGGAVEYLLQIGVTQEQLSEIRKKLLPKAGE